MLMFAGIHCYALGAAVMQSEVKAPAMNRFHGWHNHAWQLEVLGLLKGFIMAMRHIVYVHF